MASQIDELNLTIPDALEIIEQQRVLIENFSLLLMEIVQIDERLTSLENP